MFIYPFLFLFFFRERKDQGLLQFHLKAQCYILILIRKFTSEKRLENCWNHSIPALKMRCKKYAEDRSSGNCRTQELPWIKTIYWHPTTPAPEEGRTNNAGSTQEEIATRRNSSSTTYSQGYTKIDNKIKGKEKETLTKDIYRNISKTETL